MPALKRPGGVEIHWEARGEGPLVMFLHHCLAHPGVYEALLDDLARDHRVVTYDPRGAGRSSERGPYELEVDVADAAALAGELGGGMVAVGLGDGRDRATRVAGLHPELVRAVVGCGATPVGQSISGVEGPGASPAVLEAVVGLAGSSYRAALRSVLELTNPELGEDELRSRLEATAAYASPEATSARLRWFVREDIVEVARAIGERLWIVYWESAWAPQEAAARVREILPEAHIDAVDDGPISRPDLTADVVRSVVARR